MVNITTFTNTTDGSLVGIAQAINTESGGLFGIVILLAIYVVVFIIANKGGDSKNAFVVSAFIGGIMGIIFRLAQIIANDAVVFIGIILIVIGALVLIWSKE